MVSPMDWFDMSEVGSSHRVELLRYDCHTRGKLKFVKVKVGGKLNGISD